MNVKVNSLSTLYHPVSLCRRLSCHWGTSCVGSSPVRKADNISHHLRSEFQTDPSDKKENSKEQTLLCVKTLVLREQGGKWE